MTTLGQALGASSTSGAEPRKAPAIVPVDPSHFADTCDRRPDATVLLGLRRINEKTVEIARANASEEAWEQIANVLDYAKREDAYLDATMCWMVSAALCLVEDARTAYLRGGVDELRTTFTPEGIRFLYQHLEKLHLERSPVVTEIAVDGVGDLVSRLTKDPALESTNLSGPRARCLRRLLGFVLDELAGEDAPTEDDPVATAS